MEKDITRYDNVPISEKTKEGMTLNIDDLAAIGRLLSLQDNVYDEQFEKLFDLLEKIDKRLTRIESKQKNHELRIKCLEDKFEKFEGVIDKLTA